MKEFLYVLRATRLEMLTRGPTPEEAAIAETHFRYLQELTAKGTMILVGRTLNDDADTMGLAILLLSPQWNQ